jgi:hypothetical protein
MGDLQLPLQLCEVPVRLRRIGHGLNNLLSENLVGNLLVILSNDDETAVRDDAEATQQPLTHPDAQRGTDFRIK